MINNFCKFILIVSIFIQLSTGTVTTFKDIKKLSFNSSKLVKDHIFQLECKSNEELCKFTPQIVHCVNLNFKKEAEPKFECKSRPDLNKNVLFDDKQIICSIPNDYENKSIFKSFDRSIELDSCRFLFTFKSNLEYERVIDDKTIYVKTINGNNKSKSKKADKPNLLYFMLIGAVASILFGLILGFISLLVFKKKSSNRQNLIYESETPPIVETISSQIASSSYR